MTTYEKLSLKREAIRSMIETVNSMVDILKVFGKYHMEMDPEDSRKILDDLENCRNQNNKIVAILDKLV